MESTVLEDGTQRGATMAAKVKGASAKFNATTYVSRNVFTGVRTLTGKAAADQRDRAARALAKAKPRAIA